MTTPRSDTVIPGQPGLFHCYSRCVRRGFLCGHDEVTGRDYEYRKQWIVDRLKVVTQLFAVDVYSYAVMSNHYHVVLMVDPERVNDWDDEEVKSRWSEVFSWKRKDNLPAKYPSYMAPEKIEQWRERLGSLSWIMRCINEPVACWSNFEDEVTGHFWESRFKSRPVLDDGGLVTCMGYTDLNPIRAGMAEELCECSYTSITERMANYEDSGLDENKSEGELLGPILSTNDEPLQLNLTERRYIQILQESVVKELGKRDVSTKVLSRLNISLGAWVQVTERMPELFHTVVGNQESCAKYLKQTNRDRDYDATNRKMIFGSGD